MLASDGLNVSLGYLHFSHTEKTPDVERNSSGNLVTGESSFKRAYSVANVGVCYILSNICLGGKAAFADRTIIYETDISGSTSSETTKTSWEMAGLSVGHVNKNGVMVMANYYPYSARETNYKLDDGDTYKVTYEGKTGWSLEVGYGFKVENFYFGPQLSFIHVDYKNMRIDDGDRISVSDSEADEFIVPYLSVWWLLNN